MKKLSVVLLILAVSVAAARPGYKVISIAGGGAITGTVHCTGDVTKAGEFPVTKDRSACGSSVASPRLVTGPKRGVRNAVVYLEAVPAGKAFPPGGTVTIDQTRCEYTPHVVILPLGSPLDITNSDPVLHNVHGYEHSASAFNIAQPVKGQHSMIRQSTFTKPGFIDLTCDAGHPWMSGCVVVAPHPYYAITDSRGTYRLEHIPPGTYRLVMWHEGVVVTKREMEHGAVKKYLYEDPYIVTKEVTVGDNLTTTMDFEFGIR